MISVGRLIAIGATALMFRMLWKKATEERMRANAASDSGSEQEPVDVGALAEEKPDLQGTATGTASL